MLSPNMGVLVITHYQRLLDYIKPDAGPCPGRRADHHQRRQRAGPAAGEGGYAPILAAAGLEECCGDEAPDGAEPAASAAAVAAEPAAEPAKAASAGSAR